MPTADTSVTPTSSDQAFLREGLRGSFSEASYGGALSFMRRRYARDLTGVDVAVMGIPFDIATTGRPGARLGPRAVRAASSHIAWQTPWPYETDPFETLAVVDYGDCAFDPGRPETAPQSIADAARAVLAAGAALLSIGGDHYVTYPLLKAHAEKHGPLALVQFDAHSDLWSDGGEPGAAPRIDHGTMLWHALNEGLVTAERSVQIGLRTHTADPLGLMQIDARAVHRSGPEAIAAAVRTRVGYGPCYVTFDIDALDPAFAPGTGTPVIGGLSTWQAQEIIRDLAGLDVVGMDVVEVSPPHDCAEITALAAATLAADLLALHAARKRG